MFAAAWLPGQKRGEVPAVQAVGAHLTPTGVHCWLLHAARNRSRAKTLVLHLYDDDGQVAKRVRVKWPRLSDGEWRDINLEYQEKA